MAEVSGMRLELRADLAEVAAARRFVRVGLAGFAPALSSDAQLIASELVTNAIEHGRGGAVLVELTRDHGAVEVMVVSVGPAPDVGAVDDWKVAPADRITGRGLGIVRAVADRVRVQHDEDRLVITATLDM